MSTPETVKTDENAELQSINADYTERFGFHDAENYLYKAPKGINREIVEKISEFKNEPQWMRDFRLKALDHFLAREQPTWGSPLLAEVAAPIRGRAIDEVLVGLDAEVAHPLRLVLVLGDRLDDL